MESGIKIISAGQTAFSNARHYTLQKEMYDLLNTWERDLKVINIKAELMREWKEQIDIESDICRELQVSLDTAKIAALDKERDELIVYIFSAVRTARRSPLAAQKEAAERLHLLVKRYSGLQTESYDEQTGHTDGLLVDLAKSPFKEDIATLQLADIVTHLRTANEAFSALRTQRSNDRATTKLPPARTVRAQSDAIFARVCLLMEASYLISTVAKTKDDIAALATKMNQRISEIKTAHKLSTSQGSSTTTGKTGKDGKVDRPDTSGKNTSNDNSATWADGTQKADGE